MMRKKKEKKKNNDRKGEQNSLEDIRYAVKKSERAKNIRITIEANGSVIVTIPQKFSARQADIFVKEKSAWILRRVSYIKKFCDNTFAYQDRKEYLKYKQRAKKTIQDRVDHYNRLYKNIFSYNKISVRNTESRWGSCSSKKNLNFNYKIIFLPSKLRDYVIIHELCHLREFNHSRKFWKLVSEMIPDYKNCEKILKYKPLS